MLVVMSKAPSRRQQWGIDNLLSVSVSVLFLQQQQSRSRWGLNKEELKQSNQQGGCRWWPFMLGGRTGGSVGWPWPSVAGVWCWWWKNRNRNPRPSSGRAGRETESEERGPFLPDSDSQHLFVLRRSCSFQRTAVAVHGRRGQPGHGRGSPTATSSYSILAARASV